MGMFGKSVDTRITDTLQALAAVIQDAAYYAEYQIRHGTLAADFDKVGKKLSLGIYLGKKSKHRPQRALRRAMALLYVALYGNTPHTIKNKLDAHKDDSKAEIEAALKDAWTMHRTVSLYNDIQSIDMGVKNTMNAHLMGIKTTNPAEYQTFIDEMCDGNYSGPTLTAIEVGDLRSAYAVLKYALGGYRMADIRTAKAATAHRDKTWLENKIRTTWETYQDNLPINVHLRGLLTPFKGDLLGFMKAQSVVPYDGKIKERGAFLTLAEPLVDSGIIRARLIQRAANEVGAYQLVEEERRGKPKVRMYFLPWKDRRIVKMAIPRYQSGRNMPKIFFTAAINGCSVFVTGTEKNPTIYHAGISKDLQESDYSGTDVTLRKAARDGDAPLFWRTLLAQLEPGVQVIGEVNKTHYVKDGTRSQYDNSFITARSNTYERIIRHRHKDLTFETVSPWGCVFGLRNPRNHKWSFYLQENVLLHYHVTATPAQKFATCRPIFISQFYPTSENIYDGVRAGIPNPTTLSETIIARP